MGPLSMLVGTWNGQGNTMLATPAKEGLFRAIGHPLTNETLTFSVAAPTPDRGGFEQPDIFLNGLRYHHQVVDGKTMEPLHDEMGFWLNVPATKNPKASASLIRELTIPHGNAVILFGSAHEQTGPYKFPPFHAIPFPKENFPAPAIYDSDNTGDVNKQLNDAHKGLTFLKTQVLTVKTRNQGDIVNIPFLDKQAKSTDMTATFAVSIVSRDGGEPYYMLQYSQVIMLQFPALKDGPMINWPHTAVATLIKGE
uniref:THAP4-like heme-binding domain-containing protein n=1 Tax=Curvibacter symbiont subsp. Hydra magnipapillata TaxID=667019 RepID=C9YFE3_CURXX|nr:hypothetical protein Csp_D32990 [Curvibacter putative symbiont of Hydra magnipapillata]